MASRPASRNEKRRPDGRSRDRLLVGLVALCLIIVLLPSAQAQSSIDTGMLITKDSAPTQRPLEAFDAVSMAAVDLNGDGTKEILAHNDNNRFYVFDGSSGALIAELDTNHPKSWGSRVLSGPAVGDLTGNGRSDIVLTNSAGWITVFEAQPGTGSQKIVFQKLWEHFLDPHNENPNYANEMPYGHWGGFPGLDGPAFLADTNGDGRDEVFVQLDDTPGLYKLTPDGHVEWWSHTSDGNAGPLVADLSGDNRLEAVYVSDGGNVHIYDAATMQHRCSFSSRAHGTWPASISVSPTAADLTGDGRQEIVFGTRNVWHNQGDPDWIDKSNTHNFAIRHNCTLLWQKSFTWNNPHVHMHPAPVDITGNGNLDIVFQDWNTIGHKPGKWEHTGAANLYALRGDTGQLLWHRETSTSWSNNNLAIADVTGDGQDEILVNEWLHGDGLGLYSLGGERKDFLTIPSGWQVTKGPLVADLNGNGRLDIVLPLHRGANFCTQSKDIGCREGALQIYHTPSQATPTYANNHVLRAATQGTGTPAPAPSPTDFQADFKGVRGNNWWVETDLIANRAVSNVHARVDDGNWIPLRATTWGSWAESFHVQDGRTIQFRATANDGSTALSDCYTWTKAQRTSCPDPEQGAPPPGESPGVTFSNTRGNEWWVETEVGSQRTVSDLLARINGGTWQSLDATDWGSWARSIHAPDSSIVQFQAILDDGTTDRSDCYRWTQAQPTTCPESGAGGDPGFQATFTNVRGNAWWVETNVGSERDLAAVHTRINGGPWHSLDATNWGSWALSVPAPAGSTVEFRATAEDGSSVHSGEYPWPP